MGRTGDNGDNELNKFPTVQFNLFNDTGLCSRRINVFLQGKMGVTYNYKLDDGIINLFFFFF